MSKRRSQLLALGIVLLAAAGAGTWYVWPRKTVLTVEVNGTPGLAFQGTCEVDGKPQELTGTVPTQFVFEGHRVTYSFRSDESAGEFRIRALIRDRACGSAGSLSPPSLGVRGWVRSGWAGALPEHWIEVFNKDKQPDWLKPPPGQG